jgi:hypothetical protein
MKYTESDVFLDAEDCMKIAPFVPMDRLRDWKWYHIQPYGCAEQSAIIQVSPKDLAYLRDHNKLIVPALDCGILGQLILCEIKKQSRRTIGSRRLIGAYGQALLNTEVWLRFLGLPRIDQQVFDKKTELQNRRDALMYLIEHKLIEEVK